jgi:hypothetical protein
LQRHNSKDSDIIEDISNEDYEHEEAKMQAEISPDDQEYFDPDHVVADIDVDEEHIGEGSDMIEEELTPRDNLPVMRQS